MTKAELHRLVDALPDESLAAAAILRQRAQDPAAAELDAAPYGDEKLIGAQPIAPGLASRSSLSIPKFP